MAHQVPARTTKEHETMWHLFLIDLLCFDCGLRLRSATVIMIDGMMSVAGLLAIDRKKEFIVEERHAWLLLGIVQTSGDGDWLELSSEYPEGWQRG